MRYDFKCNNDKCKVDTKEVICSYSEIDVQVCECGEKMQRLYSAPMIKTNDGVKG